MKIPKDKWIWMPHPAHFICAQDCKFFMATKIGKYIVSTVGEYFPDYRIRKIFAESRGKVIEGKGDEYDRNYMREIGFEELHFGGWFYETMVFKAIKSSRKGNQACKACPFQIESGQNIDEKWYKTPEEAYKGHYKLCNKWANK